MIRTKRKQYLYEKLIELYTLLYRESYPSVDFKELMSKSYWIRRNSFPEKYYSMSNNDKEEFRKTFEEFTLKKHNEMTEDEARINGFQLDIPYNDFFIDKDRYKEIVDNFINDKKNKFSNIEKRSFNIEAYLGCGPISVDTSKEGFDMKKYAEEYKKKARNCKFPTNILRNE